MDERLTIRTKHSAVLRKTVNPKGSPLRQAIRRLADYEDTGLMPEDVLKLKAEKEKRDERIRMMIIRRNGECRYCEHYKVEIGTEPCASCLTVPGHPKWEYGLLPDAKEGR